MSYSWEPRHRGEATITYLSRVLTGAGLLDIAIEAEKGWYDDYLCPPEVDDGMNIHRLVRRLNGRGNMADVIAHAAINGEFDGTKAEAEAWANTPEGRATWGLFEQHVKGSG